MSRVSRNHEYQSLERELQGEHYQALLGRLQRTEPFLRRFATWADVVAFMRKGTSRDPLKDEILRPIFRAHGQDRDHRWRTILLVIFWPALRAIHYRKRAWDDDCDARWSNVTWAFLKVICRIDVARRPDRLVQKVVNDTIHVLYEGYRQEWDRSSREIATDPDELEKLAGAVEGIDFDAMDAREVREAEVERLRSHMKAGRISEADFHLIVGTRLYGKLVREYAAEAGISFQAAKKRRQRAEAAIRRYEGQQ